VWGGFSSRFSSHLLKMGGIARVRIALLLDQIRSLHPRPQEPFSSDGFFSGYLAGFFDQ